MVMSTTISVGKAWESPRRDYNPMSFVNALLLALMVSVLLFLVALLFPGMRRLVFNGYKIAAMHNSVPQYIMGCIAGLLLVALVYGTLLFLMGWWVVVFWVASQLISCLVVK